MRSLIWRICTPRFPTERLHLLRGQEELFRGNRVFVEEAAYAHQME